MHYVQQETFAYFIVGYILKLCIQQQLYQQKHIKKFTA